jgi:hypothetical protein
MEMGAVHSFENCNLQPDYVFPFRQAEYSKSSPWELKISNTSHADGDTYENGDSGTVDCDGDNDNILVKTEVMLKGISPLFLSMLMRVI